MVITVQKLAVLSFVVFFRRGIFTTDVRWDPIMGF